MLWFLFLQENTPNSSEEDYLATHIPIYIIIIVSLLTFQTIVLVLLGQPLISPTGLRVWWGDIHSPENSQHIADWYTFTHMLHGLLMFYVTYPLPNPPITVNVAFLIGLVTAVAWEIIENTSCVIERYRKTGASTEYRGDSVTNSFFDSLAMSAGFWLAYGIPWWGTLALGLLEEVVLGVVIRDNMVLNIVQIVYPFKCISDWQERGKKEVTSTGVQEIRRGDEEDD